MASRVYPITRNPRSLELLCGVPEGTAARMEQWEKDNPEPPMNDQEAGYQHYLKREAIPEFSTLHHFQLFGWGRVRHDIVGPETYSGEIKNGAEADAFLHKHGVHLTPEQLLATEGICWG